MRSLGTLRPQTARPRLSRKALTLLAALAILLTAAVRADEQLVFGSFQNPGNAENWATRVAAMLDAPIAVEMVRDGETTWYRVVSRVLDSADSARLRRAAAVNDLRHWQITGLAAATDAQPSEAPSPETEVSVVAAPSAAAGRVPIAQEPSRNPPPIRPSERLGDPEGVSGRSDESVVQLFDLDIGAQARTFFDTGLDGQSRFHPSMSVRADYYRSWDDERQSLTLAPFYRYDSEDSERTHFDLREGFWSVVGQDWDLHVGVRQIFWGVTEFKHLVDIVNQTDQVENLDGEDKLGQPMVHLSLLRDWGILDLLLLTGFRERTFPGADGRPRFYLPVEGDDATYESSAEQARIDGAIRWSHNIGPFDFGLYYFSGTSRDPLYEPQLTAGGDLYLRPHYPVIDQVGVDAQAITGDWAWKLEAIGRSGFGDRFFAYNAGFERTLVGVFGTRADLGLVVEYLYDERGDEAFDTLFEHDIALGTRWQFNDLSDSQALVGVIWDHEYDEVAISVEASRRLGETWTLMLEGRAFTGADTPAAGMPLSPENKMGSLVKDDYVELELTKFF